MKIFTNINPKREVSKTFHSSNISKNRFKGYADDSKSGLPNRKTLYFQNLLLSLLGVCLIILLLSPLLTSQEFFIPENPLRGRFVFEQKGCITCHSIKGEGGDIGPDLGQKKFYGTFLQLASIMWNHSPEMLRRMRELDLPYPEFSHTEMDELIAYLYYLRYLGEPGDLYRGKVVLKNKGCLNCHSIGGKGDGLAPAFDNLAKYISPLYMAQALWNHEPEMNEEMKNLGLTRPIFEKGEIVDLSAYIRSASKGTIKEQIYMAPGNPKKGRKVLEQKGCLECHSLTGMKKSVAPNLLNLNWNYSVTEIAGLMWNHGSEMEDLMKDQKINWPKFNGREMADLISFMYFLGLEDDPGDIEAGETLFIAKGCVHCHGKEGLKRGDAPDLSQTKTIYSATNIAQIMWNHAPVMEEKIAAKIMQWPEFTGDEMTDLYGYIHTLRKGNEINEK
jgi:cytochrome c551/c552